MEKRQREKLVFDASAYLLLEATGDSDFGAGEKEEDSGAADDDAESTSYGLIRGRMKDDDVDDMLHSYNKDHQFRVEEDEEEEEGVVDQCRCRVAPDKNKNSKCDDDQSKLILNNDRQNRDRRFWEACLAS